MPSIWNPSKQVPSQWIQSQEAQEQAWSNATQRSTQQTTAISEQLMSEDGQEAKAVENPLRNQGQGDSDEDIAKPLVYWQDIWNEAMKKKCLVASREALKVKQNMRDGAEIAAQTAVSDSEPNVLHASPSRMPPRASSTTFSRSTIVFSDKFPPCTSENKMQTTKADANGNVSGEAMSMCYNQIKSYATEEGVCGSYTMVNEDDVEQEWVELNVAEMDDDWDIAEEAERLRINADVRNEGFNGKMREFFERERVERGRDMAKEDSEGKETQYKDQELD